MRTPFVRAALALMVFCLALAVIGDGQKGEQKMCAC
jgi:hypothetical protein